MIALLTLLRPKQWTKNLLVFAGYLFTIDQHHPTGTLLRVLSAFGLFCLLSGVGYIYNDAADIERDRMHPRKCKRPIASGAVSLPVAVTFATVLLCAGMWAAFRLDVYFGVLLGIYFLLTSAYSIQLKHMVIIDLLSISAGFVLRAVGGAVVVTTLVRPGVAERVQISPWLLICTTLLALFLGLAKRRSEIISLSEDALSHRKTLSEYSAPMLDQMLSITAASALMAYCLYTFSPLSKTGTAHPRMMITIPFVIYGLFRYLFLVQTKNAGGSPELVLLEDKPMLINIVLYIVAALVALSVKM